MENETEKKVYLRIDGSLQIQDQNDVLDRLKAAGVESIGLVSKMPGEK
jgi:biopolymer transport protein ExbD